jgi:hypothetical protein
VLDLSDGWIWVTNNEVAWINEPAQRLERLSHLDLRNTCTEEGFIEEVTRSGSNLAKIGHLAVSGCGVNDEGARALAWRNAGLPGLSGWGGAGQARASSRTCGWRGACSRMVSCWISAGARSPKWSLFSCLEPLSLANNTISQEHVEWFAQSGKPPAERLTHLNLSGSGDYSTLFRVLARDGSCMDSLRVLRLRETFLTPASLLGLRDPLLFPALETLDVRRNKVTAEEVSFLQ